MGLDHHRGGSGEPLVLVHGIGSSWQSWRPILPALEARHDVLAVDLPGFGGSAPFETSIRPTIGALADAVEGAVAAAHMADPHVAGFSLGGWVALELARRGRIQTVVAISPAGMGLPRERAFSHRTLEASYAAARLAAPHADALVSTALGRTLFFAQLLARPWAMPPGAAAEAIRALGDSPAFLETLEWTSKRGSPAKGLEEIRCPTRILWGTRDHLLLPRQGPRFVRRIPHAELVPMKGLGHVPMTDDPDVVARGILEFTAPA